ncbi:hypothetical protein [Egicoccus halophilus]|uniref:Uncharacterized protein n=1 Tax=Egicoccus halophilus TaxID=1670830 RepID=A0A8J3ABW0_9ACTN|nr:hypothetical protein [Egicoccus halophilus]GGI08032.1 hypothetical protein GCM10011354_27050 [Egicoccus halophilus]
MADDRKHLPQDSSQGTQDFQLVQVLHESRNMAAANGAFEDDGDSAWRELGGRIDRILDRLGVDGGEPATRPAAGMDRLERSSFPVELDTTDRAVASLRALGDRTDRDQLELANRAIRDLEDVLR